MDTSLKLQLDVKNNALELQNYMLDLKNWEEDMKRKEMALTNEKPKENAIPPPRNKIKRSQTENEKKHCDKPKKISAYDYSAWDKFDVEKALAEIDKEDGNGSNDKKAELEETVRDETENTKCDEFTFKDNEKFSLVDEAFYEKEMGNQFAKKEQWTDAIKCYTNAINLDSNNAIYYANRSLCFLKLKNFKSAETDATTAIQLDNKYVKAFQRRAFARQALNQLTEAKSDYEEILKLEPNNALARVEIIKINEKLNKDQGISRAAGKQTLLCFNPKNLFKNEPVKSEMKQSVNFSNEKLYSCKTTESSKNEAVLSKSKSKNTIKSTLESEKVINNDNVSVESEARIFERGDGDKVVPIQPAKLKKAVFKPLPEWCRIIQPVNIPPHKRSKKALKRIEIAITDKDEDFYSVVETKNNCLNTLDGKEEKGVICKKNEDEQLKCDRLSFDVPKTAIQFYNCWKILKKNPEECYSYLKKIQATELPQIFENSLESDFFSQLMTFLASDEMQKDPELIYNFLCGISKVKRFSSLILFMSETDKRCARKAITQAAKVKSIEEIADLLKLYELKD